VNRTRAIILTAAAAGGVFLAAACDAPARLLGARLQVLPALVVYGALSVERGGWAWAAVVGAACRDSLSANPVGVSLIPLLLIGWILAEHREIVLRESLFARWILGSLAGAVYPLLSVAILLTLGEEPLLGWRFLWGMGIWTLSGGVLSLLAFPVFDWLTDRFAYQPVTPPSFRPDREITRGRY